MKTKSFIATFATIFACVLSMGNMQAMAQQPIDRVTVYTIDGQPKSCQDNFKNLFKALGAEKASSTEGLRLVDYKLLGEVKNADQAKQYVEKMVTWETPFLSTSGSMGSVNGKNTVASSMKLETAQDILARASQEDKEIAKVGLDLMLKDISKQLIASIKTGYQVFVVNSLYNGKPIESFVFCDPKTHEVMVDLIFKSIPMGKTIERN